MPSATSASGSHQCLSTTGMPGIRSSTGMTAAVSGSLVRRMRHDMAVAGFLAAADKLETIDANGQPLGAGLLPPLSSGGASIAVPSLRFHILLIEPDMQISRIRLSDKTAYLCTRKVIRSSPDSPHRAVYPGVHRPSVLHITANATTWVVIRFPDRNPGSSFASACGAFRSSRTHYRSLLGLPQSPVLCHFQHPS